MALRAFVGIAVSYGIREAIARTSAALARSGADVRWTAAENLHLTLKFLGSVEPASLKQLENDLAVVAVRYSPILLSVAGLMAFPNRRRPRIIGVGCGGAIGEIQRLAEDVEACARRIGVPPEGRDFRSHITIGRVRSGRGAEALRSLCESRIDTPFGEMRADAFTLYESLLSPTGSRYTVLRKFPLSAGIS
ncbi:MAG: 2'-5' RNA ligase [Planctomycetes bacterium RBG_16_59_8]|nr:MAG: 2'-5' RNA ligase [Planctomycetes bacterium RBG_16_59_8]